jgi:hypothetical protein
MNIIATLSYLSGIGFQEIIVVSLFFLLPTVLWIWAIIDLLKRKFSSDANKIIWALVIIFIPIIGSLIYLIAGRNEKVNRHA